MPLPTFCFCSCFLPCSYVFHPLPTCASREFWSVCSGQALTDSLGWDSQQSLFTQQYWKQISRNHSTWKPLPTIQDLWARRVPTFSPFIPLPWTFTLWWAFKKWLLNKTQPEWHKCSRRGLRSGRLPTSHGVGPVQPLPWSASFMRLHCVSCL